MSLVIICIFLMNTENMSLDGLNECEQAHCYLCPRSHTLYSRKPIISVIINIVMKLHAANFNLLPWLWQEKRMGLSKFWRQMRGAEGVTKWSMSSKFEVFYSEFRLFISHSTRYVCFDQARLSAVWASVTTQFASSTSMKFYCLQ